MTSTDSDAAAVERVRLLCEMRRFGEAAQLARRALATNPDDATTWCLLSQSLIELDDDASALEAARRAAALTPGDEWPHRLESIALAALGHQGAALGAAMESVRCAPHAWQTHLRVATCSAALKLADQAAGAVSNALRLAPNEALVWCVAGNVAAASGDRSKAAAMYRGALQLDPQNASAQAGLARINLQGRQVANPSGLAAAASGFARATRSDPHEQSHRRGVEAVLRVFLARAAYFVFLVSFVVARIAAHSSTAAARLAPVIVLLVPAIFVARFVARLSRDVRLHLARTIRGGLIAVAVAAECCAVLAIIVGALVPERLRVPALAVAMIGAGAARLVLRIEFRRKLPQYTKSRGRPGLLTLVVAVGFVAAGVLLFVASTEAAGGAGAAGAGAVSIAIGAGIVVFYRRARR